ncbi:MAG: hypothetical protein IPK23_06575 [Rhizobiales bacterium]|nr:hypothetical protein [Hyphomicrobiales bacterium]
MKKYVLANIAMACAFALALPFLSPKAVSQGAPKAPPVVPSSSSPNSGSSFWGGYVGFGVACSALYPIGATLVLNRELTPREAISGIVGCWTFGIGGILVHQTWDPRWNRLYGRP